MRNSSGGRRMLTKIAKRFPVSSRIRSYNLFTFIHSPFFPFFLSSALPPSVHHFLPPHPTNALIASLPYSLPSFLSAVHSTCTHAIIHSVCCSNLRRKLDFGTFLVHLPSLLPIFPPLPLIRFDPWFGHSWSNLRRILHSCSCLVGVCVYFLSDFVFRFGAIKTRIKKYRKYEVRIEKNIYTRSNPCSDVFFFSDIVLTSTGNQPPG